MNLLALSRYERHVVNRLIPLLPTEGSTPLHIYLINIIYSDNAASLEGHAITHRMLGELVSEVSHNIIEFLVNNKFVGRNPDGSYEILTFTQALAAAGSLERFYEMK